MLIKSKSLLHERYADDGIVNVCILLSTPRWNVHE
jgi:hypothetical protein